MTQKEDPRLTAYARELRWALSSLPDADRDSIVDEMRSHVLDRMDAGASLEDVLASLGPADDYASAFRDAYTVATSLSSGRTPHLVGALMRNVANSASAALAGIIILAAWMFTLLIGNIALLKISDPAHVGLWKGDHFFFIGIIDDPSTGQELLGPWLLPIALASLVISLLLTRWLAVWALKRIAPRH